MKNIIRFFTLSMGIMIISCKSEPTKTEVIVVPAQHVKTEKTHTIIVEKEPQESSTTIVLDKNGVKVEAKKIDVTIKKE